MKLHPARGRWDYSGPDYWLLLNGQGVALPGSNQFCGVVLYRYLGKLRLRAWFGRWERGALKP